MKPPMRDILKHLGRLLANMFEPVTREKLPEPVRSVASRLSKEEHHNVPPKRDDDDSRKG
jgi:hypothetical protein